MENKIQCPSCAHTFDVEEFLAEKIKNAREKIEAETREEMVLEYQSLSEELDEKRKENLELKRNELKILKRESELASMQEEMKLALEKEFLEKQKELESRVAVKEREKFEFERLEMQKKLDEAVNSAEELKRKAKQGSVQIQGEIQELALEELLRNLYSFDLIEEVQKGGSGADCIQTVRNSFQIECGKIVYESKRTKSFKRDWLLKLRNDTVQCKGDVPVLVTQTMPENMNGFGIIEGVWVCRFSEVRGVSLIIREFLIKLQRERASEVNKGDKMVMLYNYLTGNEFYSHIKVIIENYQAMSAQLDKEKSAFRRQWSQREKQLEMVRTNLAELFGSIQGIAGDSLPPSADELFSMTAIE